MSGRRVTWGGTKRTLAEPVRQIGNNAGFEGAVVVEQVRECARGFGFNAGTGIYEDLLKVGIVDSAKVTRFALQNAVFLTGPLMTTEAIVAEKTKNKPSAAAMLSEDMY